MGPNIIFLFLEDHPYGREMLRIMLEGGITPACIIEESSDVAELEREKFLRRISGESIPPPVQDLCGDIPRFWVKNHNNKHCRGIIREIGPDLIVLGGTRIIRRRLLDYFILNTHPGLLPWARGSSSEAWSIFHDLPVGVTCHRIDSGVDTGPILLRRVLDVKCPCTYERVVRRNISLAGQTMLEGVRMVQSSMGSFVPQSADAGQTFSVMGSDLLEQVREKLLQGSYCPRNLFL